MDRPPANNPDSARPPSAADSGGTPRAGAATPSADDEVTRIAEPRRQTARRSAPTIEDPRAFFAVLQKSRLLDEEQLAAVRPLANRAASARELAVALARRGLLTRWQAEQLLLGRTRFFLGKYKLLDVLGHGGMGAVLKAEQSGLGRVVALKVMARSLLDSPAAINRFLREIRSVAALDHPHIIKAIDADRVGNQYFLVMEYQEGMVLKDWIRKYGRLPIDWSCECIRQAALALQHAHERNLVHRDIKPSNLLVWSDPQTHHPHVKILDMGLARFVSESAQDGDLTQTGQIMGSPDYIAPEQARNARDADIRADIFSLGCTLFHMIAGEVPFSGDTVMEKLVKRIEQDAPPLSFKRPEVPPELDRIVARMLRRDPAERFQTPAEVAAALEAFLRGEPQIPFAEPLQRTPTDSSEDWRLEPLPNELDESLSGLLAVSDADLPQTPVDTTPTAWLTPPQPPADHTADSPTVITDGPSLPAPSEPLRFPTTPPRRRSSGRQRSANATTWAVLVAITLCFLLVAFALMRGRSEAPSRSTHPPSSASAASSRPQTALPGSSRDATDGTTSSSGTVHADHPTQQLRKFAELVLQIGGTLVIAPAAGGPGVVRDVRDPQRLPDAPFDILEIDVSGVRRLPPDFWNQLPLCRHLRRLNLHGTPADDASVAVLRDLTSLRSLDLSDTDITDRTAVTIPWLRNLEELDLSGTKVTQASLDQLAAMPRLQRLALRRTGVSIYALPILGHSRSLRLVDMRGIAVAPSALEKFRQQLPDCEVLLGKPPETTDGKQRR